MENLRLIPGNDLAFTWQGPASQERRRRDSSAQVDAYIKPPHVLPFELEDCSTGDFLVKPVKVAGDPTNTTFDLAMIRCWDAQGNGLHPLSRLPLRGKRLLRDDAAHSNVCEFLRAVGKRYAELGSESRAQQMYRRIADMRESLPSDVELAEPLAGDNHLRKLADIDPALHVCMTMLEGAFEQITNFCDNVHPFFAQEGDCRGLALVARSRAMVVEGRQLFAAARVAILATDSPEAASDAGAYYYELIKTQSDAVVSLQLNMIHRLACVLDDASN